MGWMERRKRQLNVLSWDQMPTKEPAFTEEMNSFPEDVSYNTLVLLLYRRWPNGSKPDASAPAIPRGQRAPSLIKRLERWSLSKWSGKLWLAGTENSCSQICSEWCKSQLYGLLPSGSARCPQPDWENFWAKHIKGNLFFSKSRCWWSQKFIPLSTRTNKPESVRTLGVLVIPAN